MGENRNVWERLTPLAGTTTYRTMTPSEAHPDVTTSDIALALAMGSQDRLAVRLAQAKANASARGLRYAKPDAARTLWLDLAGDRRLAPLLARQNRALVLRTLMADAFVELLSGAPPDFTYSARKVKMRRANYRALYDAAHAVLSGRADDAAGEGLRILG